MVSSSVVPSALKSMPAPGTRLMRENMSARWLWPASRSAATACCFDSPAARCSPTTPEKMMSVARPISIGPVTDSATLTRDDATTRTSASAVRLQSRRAAVAPTARSSSVSRPAYPGVIHGSPRPATVRRRGVFPAVGRRGRRSCRLLRAKAAKRRFPRTSGSPQQLGMTAHGDAACRRRAPRSGRHP